MENDEESFRSICRICLNPNSKVMVSLFDENSENSLSCYGTAVLTFANVSITSNDMLPPRMCTNCLFLLKQAIKFKLKCENSHKQLVNILSKEQERDAKEKIIEYTIFMHYFPNYSDLQDSSKPVNGKYQTNDGDDNIVESDNDNPFSDSAVLKSDTIVNDKPDKGDIIDVQNHEAHIDDDMLDIIGPQDKELIPPIDEDVMLEMIEKLVNCGRKKTINQHVRRGNKKVEFKRTGRIKRVKRMIRRNVLTKRPEEPQQCEICHRVLANKRTYDSHMQKHNGYRYICEHCGKGLPGKAELQFHLVARHGTGNYLQCEHCSFKAPRKYDLIEHCRLHTGERPYACDQCGLTFRRRGIWRRHRVYHMDKSFQCPQCPRRFYLRSALAAHANNVHRRVYVYMCAKCGATYAKPATVRRHMTERHNMPRELQGKIVRITRSETSAGVDFPEQ